MENGNGGNLQKLFQRLVAMICDILQKLFFMVLSVGPIPNHIAFIMDGNRRYAKGRKLGPGAGHKAGFSSLIRVLECCYKAGVKYVTVYAFSIDNFKRDRSEVQSIMDLMMEKIDELLREESIVNSHGIRINFFGDLKLLSEPVRMAAEKAMAATCKNTKVVLSVCVAYTSTNEIVHAVQESCKEKLARDQVNSNVNGGISGSFRGYTKPSEEAYSITLEDLERHMYSAECPDPDLLIRTSGETRLSNFLLWQTTFCYLHVLDALWPEISPWWLGWVILHYQRAKPYIDKKKAAL
ncbi:dehydrodolichyl diphosphate synthase CPT3-like [Telopea speciosissima]|uniref:dehydrodolichyl diphosphate synthase CPT3-like n=1 Tax=Telopea speciosissima TaxID=54955 RepID=UPI001CC4AAA4|nr:dehydrodolichyl diphosphate synthase CPT3-like [Telopea speciosissima]XP_043708132.1 dehydrodolichyl diphosphate synthase CPT3-like [Telopea speciosissima]XP_043708133.1 dehydrodolichyl diphosphate synthase CPT3-like [Telopea speciosissima]